MDNLEVALELIRRAKQERKRLDAYTKEIDSLRRGNNPDYWQERNKIEA